MQIGNDVSAILKLILVLSPLVVLTTLIVEFYDLEGLVETKIATGWESQDTIFP